jgi:GNAT superfamily N-acetyltransferase
MPIFRRVYREDLEYIYSWLDGDDYLRQGVLESSLYRGALYGVEVDGKIEAISIIHPIGDIAWLMGARVRREARGRGIGRYMTAGLLEEAGRMGMRGAALLTSARNTPVHRICDSLGMRRIMELSSLSISKTYPGSLCYREPKLLIGIGYRELVDMVERIRSLYPMLPITPGGLVWAPADLVIREKIGSLYIVNNGDRHLLLYSGCSWALEDRCRSTLGAIVVGEGGDDLEDLSCIASQASREGLEEIIIWIRGEPRHKIESIAKWVWRSYIYYKDLSTG